MDGRIDGWMDGQTDGRTDGCTDGRMHGRTEEGQTDVEVEIVIQMLITLCLQASVIEGVIVFLSQYQIIYLNFGDLINKKQSIYFSYNENLYRDFCMY